MTNQNIARIENLISKHITNIESNGLLGWEEKIHIAEILLNLSGALVALKYASSVSKEDEEGWKE